MAVVADDVDIRIEKLGLGPFGTNAYIVICPQTGESALVDAPAEPDTIIRKLAATTPRYILLTHNHMDHTGALAELLSVLRVPLAVHDADSRNLPALPEMRLEDGDTVPLGNIRLEVVHTPGHTPGSLCFKVGRYLLSGDTLFPGGPGKTRSPADLAQIISSITGKLFTLPDDTPVHPGHGESTILKKEKDGFALFAARHRDPGLCGDVLWLSS